MQHARELHRQRRRPRHALASARVLHQRARDRQRIDTEVPLEAPVLGRDHRRSQQLGDVRERDPLAAAAVPARHRQRAQLAAEAIDDLQRTARRGMQRLRFGCTGRVCRTPDRGHAGRRHQQRDRSAPQAHARGVGSGALRMRAK